MPYPPTTFTLPIHTYWDGTPCANPRLHGLVTVHCETAGVRLTASLPHQEVPRIPLAPPGTRVANLWEYDVVECFLAGSDSYLEVELGAGGHFLALDFGAPRVCRNTYATWEPSLTFEAESAAGTAWRASLLVPWSMVPEPVVGMNAYVISGAHYLCYHPLPGVRPDFHQPERFPSLHVSRRP